MSVSLRAKLLAPLLLVGTLMGSYLYGIWIPRNLAADEAAHLRAVDQHLDSVVESLIPLLLGNQLDIINENLTALKQKNAIWHRIRLVNATGKPLYPLAGTQGLPASPPGPDVRTLKKTIQYLGVALGTLTVEVDLAPALENTRRENRSLTIMLFFMMAVVISITILTAELAVRRPVHQLAKASKRLARQDFDTPLPKASRDEIGALVGSFAAMRNDLRSYHADLLHEIGERKAAEEATVRAQQEVIDTLEQTIGVLSRAIEMRDPYTDGHQKRVSQLAVAIAEEMALPADTVTGIRLGSLIHDVGKIRIPAEILSSPRKLSQIEMDIIKTHPQAGHDILAGTAFPWQVARMVLEHHERLDGSGYPNQLRGDAICQEARIIAVADAVEAINSHRPYRPALGIEAAMEEIRKNRATLYDPDAVDSCIRIMEKRNYRFWG